MANSVSDVICRWPRTEKFSASKAAEACSDQLTNDDWYSLAIEEWLSITDAGDIPNTELFLSQFPTIRDRLKQSIDAMVSTCDIAWPRIGDSVGTYTIVNHIGSGSDSKAYLAVDTALGFRPVVLKIGRETKKEATFFGKISCPHVSQLLHFGHDTERQIDYLVFQHISRMTLLDLVDSHPDKPNRNQLTSREQDESMYFDCVYRVLRSVAIGIEYLHAIGVAHNDVKPSNVVFSETSEQLIDLNAASNVSDYGADRAVGTLEYLSSQSLSSLSVNGHLIDQARERDDNFAFCVLCFQLMTGTIPWQRTEGESIETTCQSLLNDRHRLAFSALTNRRLSSQCQHFFHRIFTDDSASVPNPTAVFAVLSESCAKKPKRLRPTVSLVGKWIVAASFLAVIAPEIARRCVGFASSGVSANDSNSKDEIARRALESAKTQMSPTEAALLAYSISQNCADPIREESLYAAAIKDGVDDAAVWNNYGFSLMMRGKNTSARDAFNEARKLNAQLFQPQQHLAYLDLVQSTETASVPETVHAISALKLCPDSIEGRRVAIAIEKRLQSYSGDSNQIEQSRLELSRQLSESAAIKPRKYPPVLSPFGRDRLVAASKSDQ